MRSHDFAIVSIPHGNTHIGPYSIARTNFHFSILKIFKPSHIQNFGLDHPAFKPEVPHGITQIVGLLNPKNHCSFTINGFFCEKIFYPGWGKLEIQIKRDFVFGRYVLGLISLSKTGYRLTQQSQRFYNLY